MLGDHRGVADVTTSYIYLPAFMNPTFDLTGLKRRLLDRQEHVQTGENAWGMQEKYAEAGFHHLDIALLPSHACMIHWYQWIERISEYLLAQFQAFRCDMHVVSGCQRFVQYGGVSRKGVVDVTSTASRALPGHDNARTHSEFV